MADNLSMGRCENCHQPDSMRPLGGNLARCNACGFVLPGARVVAAGTPTPNLPDLPGVAPGGLLRGKYRLIERLGEGAHGVSYLAEHVYLTHPCVVKVLPRRVGEATDAAIRRLREEARAGFRVHDPNVVRVLDCDVVRGVWYFVMEYVDGVNLAAILGQKLRMDWQQAVHVGLDAAQGLAAIHRAGLVHRDIKPGNLLLGTDGRVRVADLGVAGLAHERLDANGPGGPAMVGTLAYTAPEMFWSGAHVGPPADLYSLGVTLYHLISGRLPHAGARVFQQLIDLQCRPAVWPTEMGDAAPHWLVEVILRLLAIEPTERFDRAEALIERLKSPTETRPVPPPIAPTDALQPRGIGVLPFENENAGPVDDWLGYAVANYLSRALSQLPDVYVADQDGLAGVLARIPADGKTEHERLLEAGRMVGAGTVVIGRFRRTGTTVRLSIEALRSGQAGALGPVQVEGALADLGDLELTLLERLSQMVGLGRPARRPERKANLEAREKFVLGKQAYLRGEYEEASALGRAAIGLDSEFSEAIGFVGVCLARLGKYEEAEAQHRQQETLARQSGDARREAEALANLGVMNYFRGDYEAAESYLVRAASVAESLDLASESAQIRNNLGFVLFRLGRPAEAEQAFSRAIETHRAYGGLTSLVGPYNGMGNVLAEQRRYAEARIYYRRALALATEIGDRSSVGITLLHLGRCATLEGRFADAKHEFTMALNALEETRFWNGLARAYEYIAEMHMQLGNYDESARCADKRIELARQHSNVRMESAAWLQKAAALERAGRAEEAAACTARGKSAEGAAPSGDT